MCHFVQLLLVRHAQPHREVRSEGVADPGLSELGLWQAERLAQWLLHEPIDHVVVSPKRRAQLTAAPLLDQLGHEPQVDPDLDEIDRRSSIYLPTELLPTEGGQYWDDILAQRWDVIGWDPPEVFHGRVLAAWERLVATAPGERVAVFCHGGVINRIVAEVVGVGTERVNFNTPYASITRIRIDRVRERRTLVSLNEVGHFDADRSGLVGPMGDGSDYHGV